MSVDWGVASYLCLASLLSMGLLTPLAIGLGKKLGLQDDPGPRKVHPSPVPLTGGCALFLTLSLMLWGHLAGALLFRNSPFMTYFPERVRYFVGIVPLLAGKILPVYLGATVVFLTGLVDDIKGVSVRSRLVVQLANAGILAALGLHPSLYFLPTWVSALIGILWIVGITNAFNLLDGLDGLSAGVGLVSTLALLTIMGISQQPDIVFFLAAMAGSLLGFLRFNRHPARVFLGSSGSLLIGFLLSIMTMLVTYTSENTKNWLMPLLTPLFVLAVPLYDTASVILIRITQGRPISMGDKSHFHHRLMRLGFSHRQAVAFIVLIAFSVALSAVRLVNANFIQSLVILVQIVGTFSLVIIAERVALKLRSELEAKSSTDQSRVVADNKMRNSSEIEYQQNKSS